MADNPFVVNRKDKTIEQARGYEEFKINLKEIATSESITTVITDYFASQSTTKDIITEPYTIGEDNKVITFIELRNRETGDLLPLIIEDADVGIYALLSDGNVYVHPNSTTDRGFTVSRHTGAQVDEVIVQFIIKGVNV